MSATPDVELTAAVEAAIGGGTVEWRTPHAGLSAALRFVVTLADGSSVFVKAAVDDETERWLRTDLAAMSVARDFAPDVIALTEARGRPVIVMESLHEGYWPAGVFGVPGTDRHPVVWKPGQVELLMGALDALGHVTAPASLLPLEAIHESHWPRISEAPGMFDDLQLAEDGWLATALPDLLAAEDAVELEGATLVHNDVRSDNVCFRDGSVVLVDWSDARRGAAGFDLANLLQTLPLEGGPEPQDVLPDAGAFAAWRAGEMVSRAAGLYGPVPRWLVKVMKRLALVNLHWAATSLGLHREPLRDWRLI